MLERWAAELRGERQLTAMAAVVETDLDNAEAAWNWAVAQADLYLSAKRWMASFSILTGACRCQQAEDSCRAGWPVAPAPDWQRGCSRGTAAGLAWLV